MLSFYCLKFECLGIISVKNIASLLFGCSSAILFSIILIPDAQSCILNDLELVSSLTAVGLFLMVNNLSLIYDKFPNFISSGF